MQLLLRIVKLLRLTADRRDGLYCLPIPGTWSLGMAPDEFIIKKAALRRWSRRVAELIAEPQRRNLPSELIAALQDLVPYEYSTGYLFRQNAAPLVVYDESPGEPVSYVESPYLLDPAYARFVNGDLPLIARLADLEPDDFRKTEFFAQYYGLFDIVEEICISVPVADDTTLHMSVYRVGDSPEFSASDEQLLDSLGPIIAEVTRKWWAAEPVGFSERDPQADRFHERLQNVLSNFGSSILTARERQIVHLTMRGYSDKLTARELDITPGTVRNHKKSIFSKLQVTSQGQVFGLFLDVLQQTGDGDADGDPLARLLDERKESSSHVS